MKLYWYWDEWYTLFAREPRVGDFINRNSGNCDVEDKFAKEYLKVKKRYEEMTKELIKITRKERIK